MIPSLPSRRSARRKRAVSGTGQGGEHEAFRDSCPMAYFEPCFRDGFRLRIQGCGYGSGQRGSNPGAYKALMGGCAGARAFGLRPGNVSGLQTVSVPLATALSLYNWKWLSNPDHAAEADVLVRIWWMTGGPQYIREWADPFYRPGLSFGTGIGFGSSRGAGAVRVSRRVRCGCRCRACFSSFVVVRSTLARAMPGTRVRCGRYRSLPFRDACVPAWRYRN